MYKALFLQYSTSAEQWIKHIGYKTLDKTDITVILYIGYNTLDKTDITVILYIGYNTLDKTDITVILDQ